MKLLSEMGRYATVVIDPPWPVKPFEFKRSGLSLSNNIDYPTVPLEAIGEMPVADVLADDALVFCWTVNRFLPYSFNIMGEWGLAYAYTMTWVKPGGVQVPGSPQFNAEWCIVGRKGRPQYRETKAFSTANHWPRGAHSEKPDGFYDLLRRVTPGPRLDIFGRRRIAGFDSWGNEAPDGPALPDHYQQVLLG